MQPDMLISVANGGDELVRASSASNKGPRKYKPIIKTVRKDQELTSNTSPNIKSSVNRG
jgi:hypothetical protein